METLINNESALELLQLIGLDNSKRPSLALLAVSDSKYLRDLKLNLKTVLKPDNLSEKDALLIALACAANEKNNVLINHFAEQSKTLLASNEEISETIACASLLSSNNVLYRFRHFTKKEKYQQIPPRLRMSIMMNPVVGKELFELISLAVSAVNGCEMCVNAHEHSLIELGTSEERIFDAIRIASVITSLGKIIY